MSGILRRLHGGRSRLDTQAQAVELAIHGVEQGLMPVGGEHRIVPSDDRGLHQEADEASHVARRGEHDRLRPRCRTWGAVPGKAAAERTATLLPGTISGAGKRVKNGETPPRRDGDYSSSRITAVP